MTTMVTSASSAARPVLAEVACTSQALQLLRAQQTVCEDAVAPPVSETLRCGLRLSSILLWNADELRDPPQAPCCLRTTCAGSRAAVYRTGPGGGVAAVVDFTADAAARPHGGWAAEGVVHVLDRPLPRSLLLADDVLGPVFRHLRGRRRLPEPAAQRLDRLLWPQGDC